MRLEIENDQQLIAHFFSNKYKIFFLKLNFSDICFQVNFFLKIIPNLEPISWHVKELSNELY